MRLFEKNFLNIFKNFQISESQLVASVTSGFDSGSAGSGFDVYRSGGSEASLRLRETVWCLLWICQRFLWL
jgi:hypothetical protein